MRRPGSAEGKKQLRERRKGKFRSFELKGPIPLPPSPDLPREEKPSSDFAATSSGQLQPKGVRITTWDTQHVMAWKGVRMPKPVYVRKDSLGAFHTYPDLGGPFLKFDALQSALHTHARDSSTDTSKETQKDRIIRENLFWSDGTRMVSTRLEIADREAEDVHRLVQALLDKQNDDQDLDFELKDIVHWQRICECAHEWYYHLIITVKSKGANDDAGSANLFFAEVTLDQNDMPGYFLSCFYDLDCSKDEVLCHGCMNNGSTDMKHPPTGSYDGGHVDIGFPVGFGPCNEKQWREPQSKEEDDEEEQLRIEAEERIKESFDYLDDMEFLEKLRKKRAKMLLASESKIKFCRVQD